QSIILDEPVKETSFDYQKDLPPEPQTLYMRVAAQDPSGALGDFSPLEKIQIQSVSEISREYVQTEPSLPVAQAPSPSPTPTPTPHVVARPAAHPAPRPTSAPSRPAPKAVATFTRAPV